MIKNQIHQACETIPGFADLLETYTRKLVIKGVSKNTIHSYTRTLAQIALHFGCLPTELSQKQLESYLYHMRTTHTGPTAFKFAVYAMRSLYDSVGKKRFKTRLPKIPMTGKLPVVLSKSECKKLIAGAQKFRDRFLIAFMYSSGLRVLETLNLRISDVDCERKQIHVRESKYNKDRYVPLSNYIADSMAKYLAAYQPKEFLFNSTKYGKQFSTRGLQRVIRAAGQAANIGKGVSAHVLRHSYATHLLESGVNLLTIKNVLGHSSIQTTMVYLHVAQVQPAEFKNPLDELYGFQHKKQKPEP
jgi:integrase/recombinase XerD